MTLLSDALSVASEWKFVPESVTQLQHMHCSRRVIGIWRRVFRDEKKQKCLAHMC